MIITTADVETTLSGIGSGKDLPAKTFLVGDSSGYWMY